MAKGRERGKRMNARKACNSLLLTHLGVGSSLLDIGYWKEVRDPPRTQTHGHKIARRQHLNVINISALWSRRFSLPGNSSAVDGHEAVAHDDPPIRRAWNQWHKRGARNPDQMYKPLSLHDPADRHEAL